jgi:mRNA-degrading endonuclease RelE of RelBE toxin-antitoxin system
LPKDIALRLTKKMCQLKENPFRYLKHFEGGGYKFRVGDYRALIDVDFTRKVLVVRVLDKRGRIYKR